MNEINQAILLIREIKDEWYQKPNDFYHTKKEMFEIRSYQRWALDEMERCLSENKYEHPIDVIEKFRYDMDFASTETNSATANYIFSIAVDMAMDFLDVLKASM